MTNKSKQILTKVITEIPTDDDLKWIIEFANSERKLRKEKTLQNLIDRSLDKYDETNALGKRMYNVKEVCQITGIGYVRITKVIKEREKETTTDDKQSTTE